MRTFVSIQAPFFYSRMILADRMIQGQRMIFSEIRQLSSFHLAQQILESMCLLLVAALLSHQQLRSEVKLRVYPHAWEPFSSLFS